MTPYVNGPWGCVQVGLEMVKHNGDSVCPEGPKLQLSNSGKRKRSTGAPQGSPVHQQSGLNSV